MLKPFEAINYCHSVGNRIVTHYSLTAQNNKSLSLARLSRLPIKGFSCYLNGVKMPRSRIASILADIGHKNTVVKIIANYDENNGVETGVSVKTFKSLAAYQRNETHNFN